MTNYCLPKLPTEYWIRLLKYQCKNCEMTFQIEIPVGDDVVKFESQGRSQIKWLPMYGNSGYLGLFKKFYPDHKGEIYPKTAHAFVAKLNSYIEKDNATDYFQLSYDKHECVNCKSKQIVVLSEEILENPNLDWMKISCEIIQE